MQDSLFFEWWRESGRAFQSVMTANQLHDVLHQQTTNLAFDYFAFCIRHPIPFTRQNLIIHSTNYPELWLEHYQNQNYSRLDPVSNLQPGWRQFLPWDDSLFEDVQGFREASREHGLRCGYTQYITSPSRTIGFLSLASKSVRPRQIASEELMLRMQRLCELSMITLERIDCPQSKARTMRLSKREREVLQWTAEGKTSAEIAIILDISENTVNFHQKNMQKRFNAPNKTQIACYAAAIGII